MLLFANYFAEHSIHTLKLSLANCQQNIDSNLELTKLLKPFEAINVRKLEIEVGIHFVCAKNVNSEFGQGNIGDELFVAILKAFWNGNLACLRISKVHLILLSVN